MAVRTSKAEWKGDLKKGKGRMALGSGAFEGAFSFGTRFEEEQGTNPEELIGAAHAGCFSMALSAALSGEGYVPDEVKTTASVHLEKSGDGFAITRIELNTEARIPNISEEEFQKFADGAKKNCPVSKALAGTQINLNARLLS